MFKILIFSNSIFFSFKGNAGHFSQYNKKQPKFILNFVIQPIFCYIFPVKQADFRFCVQINSRKDIKVCRKEMQCSKENILSFFQIDCTADRLLTDKMNFHLKGMFPYFKVNANQTFFKKRNKIKHFLPFKDVSERAEI